MIGLQRFCIFLGKHLEPSGALPTQYILDSCFDSQGCACPASTSQRKWLLSRLESPKHPNQLSAFSYPQCQGPWCGSTACKDLQSISTSACKNSCLSGIDPKSESETRIYQDILRTFKNSTVVSGNHGMTKMTTPEPTANTTVIDTPGRVQSFWPRRITIASMKLHSDHSVLACRQWFELV